MEPFYLANCFSYFCLHRHIWRSGPGNTDAKEHVASLCLVWVIALSMISFSFYLSAFGNYNITMTFVPSFPSLPALLYNPPYCPSNSWPLFSFIVMACICVYTDIFLNITLVHIMLLLNVSSELTIFPGKDCLYGSQLSSVSHSSLSRAEALWAFPCALCPLGFILVQLMFRQSCWWDSVDVASDIIRKQSHSTLPDLLLLQSFRSLIQNVP